MDEAGKKHCAHCGKSVTLDCSRCKISSYCDADCQKAHWPEHKQACNNVNLERTVQRAGELLQDVFFLFREKTFDEPIDRIEDTGEVLILHDGKEYKPGRFVPFPDHLVSNEKDKKMILATLMCEDAVGHFSGLLVQLLKGTDTEVEEFIVRVKVPDRRTIIYGLNNLDCQTHKMVSIKAAVSRKQWILDTTGPQYNIFSPCMEALTYRDRHVESVIRVMRAGTTKRVFEQKAKMQGNEPILARISWDAVKRLEATIQSWKTATGLTLPKLLRLSNSLFQKHRQVLLHAIEETFTKFVSEADYEKDLQETEAYWLLNRGIAEGEMDEVKRRVLDSGTTAIMHFKIREETRAGVRVTITDQEWVGSPAFFED